MKQFITKGIILYRTDYGEADRIMTFITPDEGKVKVIAKGVRKAKAKLAGSIEPFGVTDLSVIVGRSQLNTLTSARLNKNFGNIVKNLERTNTGYEFMKLLDKATEDHPEEAYFHLLNKAFQSLNDSKIPNQLTDLWFRMQLLRLSGHSPNLRTDEEGKRLTESKSYNFDFDKMRFHPSEKGQFGVNHIKFLRLGFGNNSPKVLSRISDLDKLVKNSHNFVDTILRTYIRI